MKFQAAPSYPPEHPMLKSLQETMSYGDKTSLVAPLVSIHHLSERTSEAENAQHDPHYY